MTLLYLGHLLRPVPLTAPAQFYRPRLTLNSAGLALAWGPIR